MTRRFRQSRRRHVRPGFTLLEVIVAMTILAIGIAGVMGAISSCLRASEAAESYSTAVVLAQQAAFEISRNPSLEPGTLNGTFDDASSGYSWEAEVGEGDANGLRTVEITVLWGQKHQPRHYTLHTRLRTAAEETPSGDEGAPPAAPGGSR